MVLVWAVLSSLGCTSLDLNIDAENLAVKADAVPTGLAKAGSGWTARGGAQWTKQDPGSVAGFELRWAESVVFNTVLLREKTDAVTLFRLYARRGEDWELIYEQDRIGKETLCYVEEVRTDTLRLELLESIGPVRLDSVEVYHTGSFSGRRATGSYPFKVSQYLRMDGQDIVDRLGDPGFSGYYDVVTDVIIFDNCYLASDGTPVFYQNREDGEAQFEANLSALRQIIGSRPVRIWMTIFFDQYRSGQKDLVLTAQFLNEKRDSINANIQGLVDRYGLYGIDYDWEYPESSTQWRAYEGLIQDTAAYTKVSVAIAPWRFDASRETINMVEHFNVMCYDLFDNRGHHSTIQTAGFEALAKTIYQLKIPREKILLGIPSYGRAVNRSGNSWPEYRGTVSLQPGGGYSGSLGKWGNQLPSFMYTEDGIEMNSAAYLNGYAITRDKTLLALVSGIGGLMIFRAKCDAPYTYEYSLHRAIRNVLSALLR
jgi:hypothetical protein